MSVARLHAPLARRKVVAHHGPGIRHLRIWGWSATTLSAGLVNMAVDAMLFRVLWAVHSPLGHLGLTLGYSALSWAAGSTASWGWRLYGAPAMGLPPDESRTRQAGADPWWVTLCLEGGRAVVGERLTKRCAPWLFRKGAASV